MKKHFLLLLLMTLLPLSGWAIDYDVTVTLGTINKEYGTADPGLTVSNFSITSTGGDLTKAELLPHLTYQRVTQGENVGDALYYTVLVDGGGTVTKGDDHYNVVIANNGFVNIFKKNISTGIVVEAIANRPYDGTAYEPTLTVKYTAFNNEELVLDTDYTVEFADNINKGMATATLTGIGNYEGTLDVHYSITAGEFTVAFAETPTFTYNGQTQVPTYNVMRGGTSLAAEDYTITYWTDETRNVTQVTDPTDAKTYYIKVAGVNNYEGTTVTTLSYEIAKKPLTDEDVTAVVSDAEIDKTYNGTAQKVSTGAVIVKAYVGTTGELTLVYGTDFTRENATLQNNTDVPAADAPDEQKPRFKAVAKADGNYSGERWVYFNIVPRSLNDVTISPDLEADQTYKGVKITPTTGGKLVYTNDTPTDFTLEENTDYTVAYGENKNVVKEGGVVANGGTITITGTGNYSGTVEKTFKIQPAELIVNAKNFSKNLGTADPTSAELAAGNYYEITGYVNEETAETAGVTGAPTFAIAGHTETTGTHNVISIATVGNLTAANYSFTPSATKANLIIGQAVATIAATAAEETYGYKLPTLVDNFAAGALGFTATGMLAGAEEIDKLTFTVKDANNHEYAAGDMLEAGEYTITPSAAHATTDSYVFTYTPATLTIKPYKLQIEAQNQTIDYGSEPTLDNITNTYVKMYNVNAEPKTPISTDFRDLYGVWKSDFIDGLEWEVAANHPLAEPGTIKVNLKAGYDSKNFTVTTVVGKVTYNDLGGLVLTSTDADLAAIEAANGTDVNVKIDFSLRNNRELPVGTAREWKADTWNTLVLPFDISVADLSKALGYAIVNVIDPSRTVISETGSKFYGKLTMKGGNGYVDPTDPENDAKKDTKLAANKPFMVKTADAITGIVNFGTQTIVAPASADDLSVDAGGGAKFTGIYTTKEVTGNDNANICFMVGNNNQWLYIGAGKSHVWNILPFEGFIDMTNAPAGARNMTFYFEEIDGGTTAIRNVDVDDLNGKIATEGMYNLNGMKLNTVPTQKGVYILNGKKVFIK